MVPNEGAAPGSRVACGCRTGGQCESQARSPSHRGTGGGRTVTGRRRSRCRMVTMHAVRAYTRGGPEQLMYEEVPRPEPGPGEVLVAVKAASITPDELTWPETWTLSSDGTGPDR